MKKPAEFIPPTPTPPRTSAQDALPVRRFAKDMLRESPRTGAGRKLLSRDPRAKDPKPRSNGLHKFKPPRFKRTRSSEALENKLDQALGTLSHPKMLFYVRSGISQGMREAVRRRCKYLLDAVGSA